MTYFLARSIAKKKAADEAIKSYETRQEIDDNVHALDLDERRRLLKRKWTVRGVEKDNPDRP